MLSYLFGLCTETSQDVELDHRRNHRNQSVRRFSSVLDEFEAQRNEVERDEKEKRSENNARRDNFDLAEERERLKAFIRRGDDDDGGESIESSKKSSVVDEARRRLSKLKATIEAAFFRESF